MGLVAHPQEQTIEIPNLEISFITTGKDQVVYTVTTIIASAVVTKVQSLHISPLKLHLANVEVGLLWESCIPKSYPSTPVLMINSLPVPQNSLNMEFKKWGKTNSLTIIH